MARLTAAVHTAQMISDQFAGFGEALQVEADAENRDEIEHDDADIDAEKREHPGLEKESRRGEQRCNRLHLIMLWKGMGGSQAALNI
jgi:hypothetical protein